MKTSRNPPTVEGSDKLQIRERTRAGKGIGRQLCSLSCGGPARGASLRHGQQRRDPRCFGSSQSELMRLPLFRGSEAWDSAKTDSLKEAPHPPHPHSRQEIRQVACEGKSQSDRRRRREECSQRRGCRSAALPVSFSRITNAARLQERLQLARRKKTAKLCELTEQGPRREADGRSMEKFSRLP